MWYRACLLPVAIVLVVSCGDDAPEPRDLAAPVAGDMVEVLDLSAPPDLAPARCDQPAAMSYSELVQYVWQQVGSPVSQQAFSGTTVAVHNDGTIDRSVTPPPTSPDRFSCSFTEKDVDPFSCTAPCCPSTVNQPQPLSPVVYVDKTGWVTWTTGVCAFTIGTASYTAAVSRIVTAASH